VVAAFGVFEPTFLGAAYERARRTVARSEMLAARAEVAAAGLERVLGDAPDVAALGSLLLATTDGLDGVARPLFSGLRELSLPESVHGRLWRGAELVREHRGDGHLAAGLTLGLGGPELNVLTELWLGYAVGEYSSTRGLGADTLASAVSRLRDRGWIDATGDLTNDGRGARLEIEATTDGGQQQLIGADGKDLDRAIGLADRVSAGALRSAAAPADPRKRAAG
jgi:hypothetical protein